MKYPEDFINKIVCEDCFDVFGSFPNESFDAIVADPPFGIGKEYGNLKEVNNDPINYWKWFHPIYLEFIRMLKPGGFLAIWQTQPYFKYFWTWFGEDIHIYIGAKNFVQLRKTSINYGYDPIIMKYKDGSVPLRPNKPKRNIDFFVANTAKWVLQTNSLARKHPYPRPIDQVTEIISNFVVEGGLVLDPFVGSGTTALACKNTGRNFVGIDISEEYCDLARLRIETGV